jgi:succinyl-diaminopimelate desuccinylase
MNEEFLQLSRKLDEMTPQMIEFQKIITAIPALSPENDGEGEWDKAQIIKHYLQNRGVNDITEINAPDERAKNGVRPNLIVRIPGKDRSKTIWLMAHMDVVPAGDLSKWETDPWQAVVKDGKIYGRGTEDNQQGLTSSVFALLALQESGIQPVYDLAVIIAADEETGSKYGLEYILDKYGDMFRKDDIIIVPDAGEPDSTMIEVAEKSIVWFKFVIKGVQCHASLPYKGVNAFRAGANLVTRLERLHEIFDARNDVFDPPTSTFEPTKKEANVPNVNTIPGEDIFYLDCRVLPEYDIQQLFDEVRKIADSVEKDFGVTVDVSTVQSAQAAPPTPNDSPVVQRLQKAIKTVYQVDAKPMGIGGGTVAAVFRRAGLPVAVWSTLDDVCHQPNEYCRISSMVNDAKVFVHVCLQE